MAMPRTSSRSKPVVGSARPRLAPPRPARSAGAEFTAQAAEIGIALFPWQDTAGRYLYALGRGDAWLYQEVAVIVARQNGKTELLVPYIVKRLRMGRRIMHTAQNRELPREVFGRVADAMETHYPTLLKKRPRFANGQEEIILVNGGRYRIVAPTRGGARGPSNDDVIVDEVRELDTHEFIAAAKPTTNAAPNPQVLYLSNAGSAESEVLNAIRERAGHPVSRVVSGEPEVDPALAYLEWSAAPELGDGDQRGWIQANPSVGHMPQVLVNLERDYRSYRLGNKLAIWETEHLCRWVETMATPLVETTAWSRGEMPELEATPKLAYLGIAMDPGGTRASAAIAWARPDETFGLRLLFDVAGDPIDTDRLGRDMRAAAVRHGVRLVGFNPRTDALLAKFFPRTEAITGEKAANAAPRFVSLLEAGRIKWEDAAAVGEDLAFTTRKEHAESGSFQAVRSDDERPVTAAEAAIRALWLASTPRPEPAPGRPSAVGF